MPEMHRKTGAGLPKILAGITGAPLECLCDLPILVCKSSVEILAEGCRSILEYGDSRIRLDMGWHCVSIEGEALNLADFQRNNLTIRGKITAIRWEV